MSDSSNNCFICNESSRENCIQVTKKGLGTLIDASKQRKDGKHEIFEKKDHVFVHISCRKSYTRKCSILASIRKSEETSSDSENSSNKKDTPIKQKLRTSSDESQKSSLKDRCLFCFELLDENFISKEMKKSKRHRIEFSKVTSIPMREKVLQKAEERNDEWGKSVALRVRNVIDLVAADAIYHRLCYQLFLKNETLESYGSSKAGRPTSKHINEKMEEIFSIIEGSDECQFSINDLIGQLLGYKPDYKTVKAKLCEKYGENIVFSKIPRKKSIFTLKEHSDKILSDRWYNSRESDERGERLRIVKTAAAICREDIKATIYTTDGYPSPQNFLDSAESEIPESLRVFISGLKCSLICGKCQGVSCLNIAKIVDEDNSEDIDDPVLLQNSDTSDDSSEDDNAEIETDDDDSGEEQILDEVEAEKLKKKKEGELDKPSTPSTSAGPSKRLRFA